jgi:FMN phosphatase YigB (HAD superfamily)
MSGVAPVVFLLDVDNTLLDNDCLQEDIGSHLEREFGAASRARYWAGFEALREQLGYADYLGALQRFRAEAADAERSDPRLLLLSSYLLDYPFAQRLYPDVLAMLAHLNRAGPTVILSDGDAVFQPRKIQRSGLWDAVAGRVLIYVHKEAMLEDVMRRHPAQHYVLVDDKLRILSTVKGLLGARLTTVFPRQGHYALDPQILATYPPADLTLERVGELLRCDAAALPGRYGQSARPLEYT